MINKLKKEIRDRIFSAISQRGFTYEECCQSFNSLHKDDINRHGLKQMNKDLLYRIKKENFSPSNIRVVKLCEFLHIDVVNMRNTFDLSKEALRVDELVKARPHLQEEIGSFIDNLINITNKQENRDEIY